MHIFRDKITKLSIEWNERSMTEADFYRLCKRFKITVKEMPLRVGGFYYRVMGRDFIAIDSKLAGTQKLAVLFHELAHFLFHVPDSGVTANFHGVGRQTRKEREADVFAFCAIISLVWLETRTVHELIDDESIPADMIAARYKIFGQYGI